MVRQGRFPAWVKVSAACDGGGGGDSPGTRVGGAGQPDFHPRRIPLKSLISEKPLRVAR